MLRVFLLPWMECGESFLLVGSEGAGTHMLLKHAQQEYPNTEIAEVNCTSETTAEIIVYALKQHCLALNTAHGMTLRAAGDKRLVLFLSYLHLPRPEKYDTLEVVTFFLQAAAQLTQILR